MTAYQLDAGDHDVVITDANGCTITTTITITEPVVLSATMLSTDATCNGLSDGGATSSATGGTMPYSYTWSNAATTASITGVSAATYTATNPGKGDWT